MVWCWRSLAYTCLSGKVSFDRDNVRRKPFSVVYLSSFRCERHTV